MTFAEMLEAESGDTIRLAEDLSLAVLIEPGLIRRARLRSAANLDAGVEADLWFSAFVAIRGTDGIVLSREAAEGLRARLATSKPRLNGAWQLLRHAHENASPALRIEEEIAWLMASGEEDALPKVKELLRTAIAALVGGERRGLAHWAVQAIARLPEQVLELEEIEILQAAALMRLGDTSATRDVPEWMSWVMPAKLAPKQAIKIRMFADLLELERTASPRSGDDGDVIRVPGIEPLKVEVDNGEHKQTVVVEPGQPARVRIGRDGARLRAEDGALYQIVPSADTERRLEREIIAFTDLLDSYKPGAMSTGLFRDIEGLSRARRRHVMVVGSPGAGKTAMLAELWRSVGERPAACHFFSNRARRWRDPDLAWRSLAAQVQRRFPQLTAASSVPIERLRELLKQVPDSEPPFLLIVDALDEMSGFPETLRHFGTLLQAETRHVAIVASCDDRYFAAGLRHLHAVDAEGIVQLNLDDRRFISPRVEAAAKAGYDPELIQAVQANLLAARLASGSRRLISDLSPRVENPVANIATRLWRELSPDAQDFLGAIATAREPLTWGRLADAVQHKGQIRSREESVSDSIGAWVARARTPDHEPTVAPLHDELRRFIQEQRGEQATIEDHAGLLATTAQWTMRDRGEFQKEYSLRYGIAHAVGARDSRQLEALVTDPYFLEARCRLDPPRQLVAELNAIRDSPVATPRVQAVGDQLSHGVSWLTRDPAAVRFLAHAGLVNAGQEPTATGLPLLRLKQPLAAPRANDREHHGAVVGCAPLHENVLVSWSADATFRVWQLPEWNLEAAVGGHAGEITACDLFENSVVSASRDGTVRVWTRSDGQGRTLVAHQAPVLGVAVVDDADRVISWDAAGAIHVSEAESGSEVHTLHEHETAVTTCMVEGPWLFSGSADHTIRAWTNVVGSYTLELPSDDSEESDDSESRVVTTVNRVLRDRLLSGATAIAFDPAEYPDRGIIARLKILARLDIAERRRPQRGWFRVKLGGRAYRLSLVTTPTANGERAELVVEPRVESRVLQGHTGAITALAWSGAASQLLSASEDGTLRIWDSADGEAVATLRGHQSAVLSCVVADSGRMAVTCSRDRSLAVWDLAAMREVRRLTGHRGAVLGCTFLTNGTLLSWSADHTLRLWDWETGVVLAVFEGHRGPVNFARELANGHIVSCCDDRSILEWSLPGAWLNR